MNYIKFKDLKVGEKYLNQLSKQVVECECILKFGEKVFRTNTGRFFVLDEKTNHNFTIYKKPFLTDESIGKCYYENKGAVYKIYGKIEVEGDICFVGKDTDYESLSFLFLENGKARGNDWGLIEEVKNDKV